MKSRIFSFKYELETELSELLKYWLTMTSDDGFGGFYGQIDEHNNVAPKAEKGLVLNARILWTFSAAFKFTNDPLHLEIADRAYHYLKNHFADKTNGGLYWSVTFDGEPLQTKKQLYGQAFAIYGLSEYYNIAQNPEALEWAISLFKVLETHGFDEKNNGYWEAFSINWQPISNVKLSEKDANEPKSMNTHLHILEAYANLLKVWKNDHLAGKLTQLIRLFLDKIIDQETGSQILFFDDEWNKKSDIISFGHDIETSWLLLEAAEIIGDKSLTEEVRKVSELLAKSTASYLTETGGLSYETEDSHTITDRHWWVQAEAMVGFYNAFELTESPKYLDYSVAIWEYVKTHFKNNSGEWYWGIVAETGLPMPGQDKIGFWKCPYHNVRACLEVVNRIDRQFSR
jgi:mannobiose 2-epimerase